MEIEKLIAQLEASAAVEWTCEHITTAQTCRKAAETIRLLWEVVRDTQNEKYKMLFDEWMGEKS